MRRHAKAALGSSEKGSLLMFTKLRKHHAIITQILKLGKNDLEQLASFMGHTEKTHAEFYRLPNDVYQVAKVSKLLMLSKSTVLDENYKGKSLAEINVGTDLISDSDASADADDPEAEAAEQELALFRDDNDEGEQVAIIKKRCETNFGTVDQTTERSDRKILQKTHF